jgi:signal transduction histidine kinase
VLAGAALALLAGLAVARRAMTPIAGLTKAAREIERTRDPTLRIPHPQGGNDEVAELARTLEGMLQALDSARSETEATLARQREFVADASHELRTPLTSVLANLELLDAQLEGEQGDSAKAALRSAQRMRRLVGNLLLLARADAGRAAPRAPTDMGAVLAEAAAELQPVSGQHELSLETRPVFVQGARDELHRMAVNLIENAIRHTPDGTQVRARVTADNGDVTITVEDDGPGVPDELAPRIFDRFVRGGGERAGSSGLGLAIVRAVAEGHGGTVALERSTNGSGARFVVTLPAARAEQPAFSHA